MRALMWRLVQVLAVAAAGVMAGGGSGPLTRPTAAGPSATQPTVAQPPAKVESALSKLAASMPNRSWRELETQDLDKLKLYGKRSSCLSFAQDLAYERKSQTILFLGVGHGGDNPNFLVYDLRSNRWEDSASGKRPWPEGTVSHAYDMSTADTDRHTFCHIYRGDFMEYDPVSGKWTVKKGFVPTDTDKFYTGPGGAVEYFPPLKTFVLFNCRRGPCLALLDPQTREWRMVEGFAMPADLHNLMVYNPHTKRLYFGGGNKTNAFYEMDAAEKVVKLPDAPETYRSVSCNLFCDPLTGDVLLLHHRSGKMYAFDTTKRTWALADAAPVIVKPPGVPQDKHERLALCCEVPEQGVAFFLSNAFGRHPVVYLYKHGPQESEKAEE